MSVRVTEAGAVVVAADGGKVRVTEDGAVVVGGGGSARVTEAGAVVLASGGQVRVSEAGVVVVSLWSATVETAVTQVGGAVLVEQTPATRPTQTGAAAIYPAAQVTLATQSGAAAIFPSQETVATQVGAAVVVPNQETAATQLGAAAVYPFDLSNTVATQVGAAVVYPLQETVATQVGAGVVLQPPAPDLRATQLGGASIYDFGLRTVITQLGLGVVYPRRRLGISRAYFLGPARGGPTPPTPAPPPPTCGFDEDFDEADYTAYYDKYIAQSNAISPGSLGFLAPTDALITGFVSMASSEMRFQGSGSGTPDPASLSTWAGPWAATQEMWAECLFEIIGGDWDYTTGYASYFAPVTFNVTNADQSMTFGISVRNTSPVSARVYSAFAGTDVDFQHTDSTVSYHVPVGSYRFVLCASQPTSSTLQLDAWVNPTTGASPFGTLTLAKDPALTGFLTTRWTVEAPLAADRAVAIQRLHYVCGSRASDPFGIL